MHVPREGEAPKPTSTNQGRQGKEGRSMEGGEGVGLSEAGGRDGRREGNGWEKVLSVARQRGAPLLV